MGDHNTSKGRKDCPTAIQAMRRKKWERQEALLEKVPKAALMRSGTYRAVPEERMSQGEEQA
jgi:hypothetical protein